MENWYGNCKLINEEHKNDINVYKGMLQEGKKDILLRSELD